MMNFDDIKIIDKREGAILWEAMKDYRTKMWPKRGEKPDMEFKAIHELAEEIKHFVFDR